jgi:signal transduction histidine kinase/CheY-like chemotaxis protein
MARQERPRPSDREQAELIRGLYRNVPIGVFGALFGVTVLSWVLVHIAPSRGPVVGVWFGLTLAVAAWQIAVWAWYWRRPRPDEAWRVWARRLVLASLAEGFRWGLGGVFLAAPGHVEQQVWVYMVVACAASGSVSSLGSYIPAFYALLFPAMMPFVVWSAFQPNPLYWALGLLALALMGSVAVLGFGQSRFLAQALRLRFENLDLVDDLRRQKDIAEQANFAKTQFLAAASHDLRQPMHALGLFVAALSRTRMRPEGKRLTGQIAETVEAMGGLFGTLLDVSQLDAGMVTPEPRAFAIDPLLARLCREQAGDFGGRPVTLRWVASGAVVETDPALLERMVRNLISNAVRHTREGRILVGCRRRGGRLSVQVWDTGPGIAAEHRAAVFEEYYQLGNPERDRTKGLGLGLAITRRLAALLDCPIGLRSQLGRGSMFSLDVPRAAAGVRPPDLADVARPAGPLQGLVFVIDDELMVQQSMTQLLNAWGYEVVVGGSAEELMARADPARAPDLVICDWRLRGEETPLGAMARVRGAYAADIPALLITGDTAPERLRAAHDTGLVLLHKPVPPGKLRAALGNLIARAEPQALAVR